MAYAGLVPFQGPFGRLGLRRFLRFRLFLLVSTLEAKVAPVDVWALVVVAPLLVFSTLCISFGTTYRWWTGQALSIDQLQEGFARNRAWERPSRALGQHVVLLHAALATLLPVVWIMDVAISPGNALGGAIGDAFTTEHFEVLLTDPEFWLWTRNSIIVAVGTTVFGLALPSPPAMHLVVIALAVTKKHSSSLCWFRCFRAP